ncbi:MAG: cytochrome P450 [Gemmatimonadetes bacterium]|nr:cytochrome P450 [Gemmatimonadota bacterium]
MTGLAQPEAIPTMVPAPHTAWRPPAPVPRGAVPSLLRLVWRREKDLLSLLPDVAYRDMVAPLGYTRRGILLVNDPTWVERVLDDHDTFPKNDLFVEALADLVGDSMFVTSGDRWRRQRRMVDPAFSHMRLGHAFDFMAGAVDAAESRLDALTGSGEAWSLDAAMSHLTADVITRTIFSVPLEAGASQEVFDDFSHFERQVGSIDLKRLLWDLPWSPHRQPQVVREACARIRRHLGTMLDARLARPECDDIAGSVLDARDPETGEPFSREELIDQLGVFFLAGHETTASSLTWAVFILSQRPDVVARLRAEVDAAVGSGPVTLDAVKRLSYVRMFFKEVLRLYPPITFLPRVAMTDTTIAGRAVPRGTMLMISPWCIHRHERLWRDPARFDPERFAPGGEAEQVRGAYLPFGTGPRICVGAGFAAIETALILARLVRRYDFTTLAPERVRPYARLTTRPAEEIMMTVRSA